MEDILDELDEVERYVEVRERPEPFERTLTLFCFASFAGDFANSAKMNRQ